MRLPKLSLSVVRKADVPFSAAWLAKVIATALAVARKRGSYEVTLGIVHDAEMRRLNSLYRGKDKTTDVLSFPSEEKRFLGDILISPAQIRRQAREFKRSIRSEFAMMLVHGSLHLLGYDHETPKDAARMFPLQGKALKELNLL